MPLLGNFSDTCCIHCCYKNIVPPHFHNVVLTYIHSSSIFAPTPVFFPNFFACWNLNPCSRRYLLKSELSIFLWLFYILVLFKISQRYFFTIFKSQIAKKTELFLILYDTGDKLFQNKNIYLKKFLVGN